MTPPFSSRAEGREDLVGTEASAGGKCHEGRMRLDAPQDLAIPIAPLREPVATVTS
jgi:hypothetical protein